MLFNADKNTKGALLQMYKKDAEEFQTRKNEERNKRIQEERSYIEGLNLKDREEMNRVQVEKQKRINEIMHDYQNTANYQNSNKFNRNNKNIEINTGTYGAGIERTTPQNPNIHEEQYTRERTLDKHASLSPKRSNMNMILERDKFNNLSDYDYKVRSQKVEQQKMYRDYLDGQVIVGILLS